jgi:hypothetical protein
MILTLTIECVFGAYLQERCVRVIEIDEQASLYGLHDVIQDALGFDRDHPYEFFLANSPSPFAQREWLTDAEAWEDKQEDFFNTALSEIYPLGRKRLYYLFDFGDNWLFEVRKGRGSKPPEDGIRYPRVVDRIGPNPEQYPQTEDW